MHVKVSDTAEVVSRVLTEKAAGRTEGGAVDLVWINGENFAAMKREGLLQPTAWATTLPNYRFVDVENKPTVASDFTVPVDGLEAPWGMAKLVFFHDTARLAEPPRSAAALGEWIAENPGRFTYPQPPDFIGTTFLKQLLVELAPDPAVLAAAGDRREFRGRHGAALRLARRGAAEISGASGRAFPRDYGGAAPAARRRRGGHRLRLQPVRRVERHRQRRAAGHGAQLRLRRRHARQHAFRGDPLQRRAPPPARWCLPIS